MDNAKILNFRMRREKGFWLCTPDNFLSWNLFRSGVAKKLDSKRSFITRYKKNFLLTSSSFDEASINFVVIYVTFFLPLSPSENDLVFHFFGIEGDSMRVREAINKMVEKGRIGNFSLVSTHYALHQEPGLLLQVRAIYLVHHIHFITNSRNDV